MATPRKSHQSNQSKAEVAKLRAENERLKTEIAKQKTRSGRGRRGFHWRPIVVWLLVALALALLVVGNLFFWLGNTVVKTDRFVATTEPVIKDSQVQQTMALYTTNSIFENVDVQSYIEQVLPPRADFLAPQLTSQVKSGTQSALQKVLASPEFQTKWNQVQARQHDRLINFIEKYQGDGTISLNDIFNQLTQSLKDTKLSFLAGKTLPSKVGDITVINATWLPTAHRVVTKIDTWRLLSVILLVAFIALAVWLSRNRRRTIYIFSLFAAVLMFLTMVSVRILREHLVDTAKPEYQSGVASALKIVSRPLLVQTFTILLVALFLAIVTWISGPSRGAMTVKRGVGQLFSGNLHNVIFGETRMRGFTRWVSQHKRVLDWIAVVVIAIIMLLVRLTPLALLLYALLLLLIILAIEIIGGEAEPAKR